MSLFFGSFTKALLSVFEFPSNDDFAYKLDLPVTGEADELSLVLLSSGLDGEYIYDIAVGLDETQLSKYRSGSRSVHRDVVARYKSTDVRERVKPFFQENITPNIPKERHYDLLQELLDLIDGDSRISDRQKHEFRKSALNDSLNDFLIEVFIYAVKSPIPEKNPNQPTAKLVYKNGRHRVYNCPYDPTGAYLEQDEINIVRQYFADGKHTVAICGEHGIGKTELALRYACEAALDTRRTVIWIDAKSEATILISLRQFLLEKNLDKNATSTKLVADSVIKDEYLSWANINEDWLIIFDNVGPAKNGDQAYLQYMPQNTKGDILLTVSDECPAVAAGVVLEPRKDKTAAYNYLRRRYGDQYLFTPFTPDPPFTFQNIPFVLELMSSYALATGDFELKVLKGRSVDFFEPGESEPMIDDELGMIVLVRSHGDIEEQINGMSCEDLIQKAFNLLWSYIDSPYKFLLQMVANMPDGELHVDTFEEVFYGDDNYKYNIPLEVPEYMLDEVEFADVLKQLVSMGVCKVSYYAKGDPRWNDHFAGLKKIRLHSLVQGYIKADKDYCGITESDFMELIEKVSS